MVLGWSRRLAVAVTVVAAAGLGACGGSSPSHEFGKADTEQIRQMVADFVAAYNAKDVEKIASLYAGEAVILPPNRSTLRGVELVRSYFEGRVNDDGATNLSF
ncbi:MAG TPA: hypothetical protein VK911_11475, partial [Vicinamibacterales bacterium]|nr:hypothetical protein [Vicinamibacterales bacterium]